MTKFIRTVISVAVTIAIIVVIILSLGKKDNQKTSSTSNASTTKTTAPNSKTSTNPSVKNVDIVGFAYSPKAVSIKVGDTVTWTNADDTNHTVTADDTMTGGLDSPILHKGETYSYVFNQAGVFKYHCKFHTVMTGTITVTN